MVRRIAFFGRLVACVGLAAGSVHAASAEESPRSASPSTHVVEAGDSLLQIALDFGVDEDALAALNGLDDANVLSVGQSLKLPATAWAATSGQTAAAPASSRSVSPDGTYTVVEGDTLWDIAQQLHVTTAALVDANHLDDGDRLALGTRLVVPAGSGSGSGSASASAAPSPPPTGSAQASPASATRPSGTGAAASAATAQASANASPAPLPSSGNGTDANLIGPKRSLLVPYTVQPGETLTQIARQFNLTSDVIATSNALDDPNRVRVGSVLKIPLPGHEHVVSAGETLRDIALQEKVDLGTLIDFNAFDDPELIRVGQVVLVPPSSARAASNAAPTTPPEAQGQQTAAAPQGPSAPAATGNATVASGPAPAATPVQPSANKPAPAPDSPKPAAPPPAVTTGGANTSVAQTSLNPAPPKPATPSTDAGAQKPAATATAVAPKPSAPVAVVSPPPGSPTDGLAGAALKLLGRPYVFGGSSPSGFDCSGLIWYVAKQVGRPLTRGMLGQYNSGSHPGRDELKPGDLVFFQNTYSPGLSHNGVALGNGMFVHAADEQAGVTISSLSTAYWSAHWFGATRLP